MGRLEQSGFEPSFELGLCWRIAYNYTEYTRDFIPRDRAQMQKKRIMPFEPFLSLWNPISACVSRGTQGMEWDVKMKQT